MKLDFGLSNTMLDKTPSEWKNYQFGITYSVTLGKEDLETTLAIRNTGQKDFEFQTLLHSYWAVDVSLLDLGWESGDGVSEVFKRQTDGACFVEYLGRLRVGARKGQFRR